MAADADCWGDEARAPTKNLPNNYDLHHDIAAILGIWDHNIGTC